MVESGVTAVDRPVPVVLPADVVGGVGGDDGAEHGGLRVLERLRVAAGGCLHRGRGEHLHQVVDDDVAQRADRVVEVPAVLDAEVFGHGDLHARDVVPVPDRLEHRVAEPEVEGLLESHLPEVVVDAEQLRFVDVLVEVFCECPGGGEVVAEGLLDDDTCVLGEAGFGEVLDDGGEQEGWDLEVEDRQPRVLDRGGDALVGGGIGEVAGHVREPCRESSEDVLVELLAGSDDGGACSFDELLGAPVVDRDADDRAIEEVSLLEAVERPEGHDLRQVAGDPEDHEDVARRRFAHGALISNQLQACGLGLVGLWGSSSSARHLQVRDDDGLGPILPSSVSPRQDDVPSSRRPVQGHEHVSARLPSTHSSAIAR